jgi:hypothetical protein
MHVAGGLSSMRCMHARAAAVEGGWGSEGPTRLHGVSCVHACPLVTHRCGLDHAKHGKIRERE